MRLGHILTAFDRWLTADPPESFAASLKAALVAALVGVLLGVIS